MIDIKSSLTVKHESLSSFTDYSHKTNNFSRDVVNIDFVSSDFIHVGFRKHINAIYFNHISSYSNDGLLKVEVFNGTSWIPATGLADDTLGLKRSGFIRFDRVQNGQVAHTLNGSTNYWYRFSLNIDRLALQISGINIVFADDYTLSLEHPFITLPEFLSDLPSHILIHSSCRNEIIQAFRNKDYIKIDSNGIKQDINAWDLLEIEEVTQAAVCLAISKIYFNMSDAHDDIWSIKSHEYRSRYEKLISAASLSLDLNDDGVLTPNENKQQKINSSFMSR